MKSIFPFSIFQPQRRPPARRIALLILAGTSLGSGAWATELVVRVSGITEPLGKIGCALFANAEGFPMDSNGARQLWLAAETKGTTCRFEHVPEGAYAVSIAHDMNGNRKVDTNFLGMPSEQWGVSRNIRPTLRAPRFEEAVFKIADDAGEVMIDIRVAK